MQKLNPKPVNGIHLANFVFSNILEDLNKCLQGPSSVLNMEQLIKSSKRMRKAALLLEVEAKQKLKLLKKKISKAEKSNISPFIKKTKASNLKEEKFGQSIEEKNFLEIKEEKAEKKQNLFSFPDKKMEFQQFPQFKEDNIQIKKEIEISQPSVIILSPSYEQEQNRRIVEEAAEEELNNAIKYQLDLQRWKKELNNNQNNNSEIAERNLSITIHNLSKLLFEQGLGMYGNIRRNIQNFLEKNEIISFEKSSRVFKKNVEFYFLEQRHIQIGMNGLLLNSQYSKNDVKYTGSSYLMPKSISKIFKKGKELILLERLVDENKLDIYKFPSISNQKKGSIKLPVSNITLYEIFSSFQQNEKSVLLHTTNNTAILTSFDPNSYLPSSKKEKHIYGVAKISFQPIQDYFAVLQNDRRKIEVFDERGISAITYELSNVSPVVSFCLRIDTDYLTLLCYLKNKVVRKVNILLPLVQPINKAIQDYATDLYLENTVVPSEKDEPELFMLGQDKFYVQFLNSLYLIKTKDIQTCTLLYDAKILLEVLIFEKLIFRVYQRDITIQLFDDNKAHNEVSVFGNQPNSLYIKKALITKQDKNYKIDMITTSVTQYTFFVEII